MMKWLWCRIVGHLDERKVINEALTDFFGERVRVDVVQWNCARCGGSGMRLRGYEVGEA